MSQNTYQHFFRKARESRAPAKNQHKTGSPADLKLRRSLNVKRNKPQFPWKAAVGLAASIAGAGLYISNPEILENISKHVEISAFGPAEASEKKAADKPAEKSPEASKEAEKPAATEKDAAQAKAADESPKSAEELSHYEKLKQRKDELDRREKELGELEEELQKQKVELDKRIQQLEQMRTQIAQVLKDRVEIDQEKVNKLVELYSNMKPKQAADVIGNINEDLAVEVLSKMKKKNAAEIMNLLPPEKARVLSEKYTGYRRGSDKS